MESHREILFVVAMTCAASGCCKEGVEPVPAASTSASATPAAAAVAEPRVEVTSTATVRTVRDAGKVATSDGETFGAPPALVGTKSTGPQPTTKEPAPDSTTFGGPPTIATSKKTPAATTTQPTSTTTPFGAPPKLP